MDNFALTLESDNDTGIFTAVQHSNVMLISIYLVTFYLSSNIKYQILNNQNLFNSTIL